MVPGEVHELVHAQPAVERTGRADALENSPLAALAETELRQLVALLDRALRGEQAGTSG